jgi:hypothetical protein
MNYLNSTFFGIITIDWSEPVSAPAPAEAPTTVESLHAKLESLQAEIAALKRSGGK